MMVRFPSLRSVMVFVAAGRALSFTIYGSTSVESSNLVAQLRATLAGAGLCILPAFLAREEPGLVRVLPGEIILTRSLWLIVHQDLAELARVKAVVRFLKETVERERALFRLNG